MLTFNMNISLLSEPAVMKIHNHMSRFSQGSHFQFKLFLEYTDQIFPSYATEMCRLVFVGKQNICGRVKEISLCEREK